MRKHSLLERAKLTVTAWTLRVRIVAALVSGTFWMVIAKARGGDL